MKMFKFLMWWEVAESNYFSSYQSQYGLLTLADRIENTLSKIATEAYLAMIVQHSTIQTVNLANGGGGFTEPIVDALNAEKGQTQNPLVYLLAAC